MSDGNFEASTLQRLKVALAREALTLKGKSSGDPLASAPPDAPDLSIDIGTWRTDCYRQLALLRPDLQAPEVAGMAVELSRDPRLVEREPSRVAIDACRLLDQSRDA